MYVGALAKGLFDHLVGGHLHEQRHVEAQGLCRLEVDEEPELGGLYDRQLSAAKPSSVDGRGELG